ncbi:bifunctional diguanylate cyclase/phosphodiesterase [Pseudanabaena sp. FACHB-1998]|uniref:putative bifunctional diguanylate cyclase/phosphodiesterase n=1 Tax=Pseudanabaena sp. FACHB-1998 TaxID=2692858 RepID=UPI001680B365|nr:bifunctional diguanylate cyclase/phosphodiesterase [Pseudanabaena sp. FACHB-1998]MBD2176315.1 bifunctional diguanylate cyclase/phosphodiesterase [Pseudanabaena sp. FACHB-1998]
MRKQFFDTLGEIIECTNRISESTNLTEQQHKDLQSIQSLSTILAKNFDELDKDTISLKLRIKQVYKAKLGEDSLNEDEINTLLALMLNRLRQSIDLEELLDTVVLEIQQLLQIDQVIVYQFTDDNHREIKCELVSVPERSLLGKELPPLYTDSEWLQCYQRCVSVVVNDISSPTVDPKVAESLLPLGIHSAISLAIPFSKKLWGLIIIHQYNHAHYWQNWEIDLLERLATQLAICIHQLQLLVKSDSIRIERDLVIEQLNHSQLHDSLTGLPNRDSFMESLDLAFTRLKLEPSMQFAVIFIDGDRFQSINDNFGISVADKVLQEIGQRLAKFQQDNITISRIDGDEFSILVENIDNQEYIFSLAEQIIESIKQPFIVNNQKIFTSVSIGIALSDLEYNYANEILRDASIAMHKSRKLGKGKYALYNMDMQQGSRVKWQLESDLRQALERQEFYLVYQPIVSLHLHQLTGFEVLLRWLHPLQGLISPQEFLPIAEESGEIIKIGYWVLDTACKQLYQWQQTIPNISPLTLAINVSTLQVIQSDFVERIHQIIKQNQVIPSLIKLEITETILMENIEVSSQKLEQLREIGVQVYIDDFGTGYSSFSYLQNLPIDVLKIDRSFTNRIFTDKKSQRIIHSILRLANNLGMGIVVEGVETLEELDYFEGLGGSSIEVQGYFISHPLDSEKATQWIQQSS